MKCSSDQECFGKNQKCHQDHRITKPFCGTKKCRGKRDCKDVGHLVSGKIIAKNTDLRGENLSRKLDEIFN